MKLIPVDKTGLSAADIMEIVKTETVVLTRKGKPEAVVKDVSGTDWECISLANNTKFVALIEESRRAYRENGGISIDKVREELGIERKQNRAGLRNLKKRSPF